MKKDFWLLGRFVLYLVMNFLWFTVASPVLMLTKRCGCPVFGYVFLVYPGTLDQVRSYVPLWFRRIAPLISVIGVVTGKVRGLVVTIPYLIKEIENGVDGNYYPNVYIVTDRVSRLAESIGAKAVALAGRMPSLLSQNGGVRPPIVSGDKGAVYTVLKSTYQAMAEAKLQPTETTIGLIGYGFLGQRVAQAIREWGVSIVAYDPKNKDHIHKGIVLTHDPADLSECQLVIVLSAKGEQARAAVEYVQKGAIWIDDTHPQMPRRLIQLIKDRGGKVVKSILTLDGVHFHPRLPKWESDWLPGCCVEAITIAAVSSGNTYELELSNQSHFNLAADRLGFRAPQVTPKSEL